MFATQDRGRFWRRVVKVSSISDSASPSDLNEHGRWLMQEGELDAAERTFQAAVDKEPRLWTAWFNLGLIYKQRRAWRNAARSNQRAAELSQARAGDAVWWNLGIAATALRDWEVARRAWTAYGVTLPAGTGPIAGDFGRACVRINPESKPEVIWVRRLDPARGRIESVPLRESEHRWGDVVLHDGAPNGRRVVGGRTYPVFDELERWEASSTPTQTASITCVTPADAVALQETFEQAQLAAEDWTESFELLCKACSEGTPDPSHRHREEKVWKTERDFGLAAPMNEANRLLSLWAAEAPASRVVLRIDGSSA